MTHEQLNWLIDNNLLGLASVVKYYVKSMQLKSTMADQLAHDESELLRELLSLHIIRFEKALMEVRSSDFKKIEKISDYWDHNWED